MPQFTRVSIKMSPTLKKEAMALAEELGITLSAYINASIKNFVRTKTISFSLTREPEKSEKDAKRDVVTTTPVPPVPTPPPRAHLTKEQLDYINLLVRGY
ncbi:hypothetical protein COT50_00815 [candidate division WWE3 bacterium CG08_land_8_20_14_0_20_41_10]|uniref:Uncharacterized protein n=1 Tax=candidate division WWE3 bacterium CG08_land_8_20_14_0_20_41_10 TaxID=1975085 RepID=A0A2H0XCL7_UNCKA|nr:MAG: hypothetical protein COT50_00815 [candidate division WWE3 bacterium CG08_land_8_20_14_0_20_41_10]